jgi:DNA ligase-1
MQFMLAKRYTPEIDPSGWLVSEKYDGWRAMWNGSAFISRDGNTLPAPASWIQAMPACVSLDGELWLGRGRFNEVQGVIRSGDWSALEFMVFDAPEVEGEIEQRIEFLRGLTLPDFCAVVPYEVCKGTVELYSLFSETVAARGEGLMLRAPRSRYDQFRSPRLLKMKPAHID